MDETIAWYDNVVDEITRKKRKEYVCEGMWTPSGFFHIGNARTEIFTPYAVHKALKDRGFKTRQNFIADDFDAIDSIPTGIGVKKEGEEKFLGYACALAPSPVKGAKTWADFFVNQVKEVVEDYGLDLKIISAYETYKKGRFNDLIIHSLNHSKEIVSVWNEIAGSSKPESFIPIQVVCGDCGKMVQGTSWDGKKAGYSCNCGCASSISPLNGNAKLHWRVHWAAHWIVHDVAYESAGKDHFSRGGSVEVGHALMERVFKREPPHQSPTEFLLLRGKKMAGSVGNVIDLNEWLKVASPESFRYLNFSYKPNTSIEFDLSDNSFLLLMDRFERAERIFYGLEEAENDKLGAKIKKAYVFSAIGKLPKKLSFQLPYSFAVLLGQLVDAEKNIDKAVEILQGTGHFPSKPSAGDRAKLRQILLRARHWAENYAPTEHKVVFVDEPPIEAFEKITSDTKAALSDIVEKLPKTRGDEGIQQLIFDSAKQNNAKPGDVFGLIYLLVLGRERGPKAGSMVAAIGRDRVAARLKEAISGREHGKKPAVKTIALPGKEELKQKMDFEISKELSKKFSSLRIGIIVAEGIDNSGSEKAVMQLLKKAEGELQEKLFGKEFASIRNLKLWREAYSAFGAKPKKYKSSIEALARRIVKGESLPNINPLVDIYNYISIKYLLPAGGDDLGKAKGKIRLSFAEGTEPFVMLGSTEKESPKEGEVVYLDDAGVLCRRWNWRECDRTKLTEKTKRAVVYIESLNPEDCLEDAVLELASLIEKHCNAKASVFIL